jgi:hypothetical protein
LPANAAESARLLAPQLLSFPCFISAPETRWPDLLVEADRPTDIELLGLGVKRSGSIAGAARLDGARKG